MTLNETQIRLEEVDKGLEVLSNSLEARSFLFLRACLGACLGGRVADGTSADSRTGLTREKVGWILREAGSRRCYAAAFTIRSTLNGPTYRGANFLTST